MRSAVNRTVNYSKRRVVNEMVNYSYDGMASEILGTLRDLRDTGQALSGLLGVLSYRRYKSH